ncbi:MAG: asparagine--tRNA ligase [Candidatus Omnitrophota bacterium]
MSETQWIYIKDLKEHADARVEVRGWIRNKRSSGKVAFLQLRDGTGFVQGVVEKETVGEETYKIVKSLKIESSIIARGKVNKDERAPGGVELYLDEFEFLHLNQEDYPIANKDHNVDFLMGYRHLWLRSKRQYHIMTIRNQIIKAIREFYFNNGFKEIDTPIFTGSIGESAGNLFELDYYDYGKVYLAQTGQLYLEAAALAYGKVFDFGPTFRAEKSKTRRHLIEFWMNDTEVAFYRHADNLRLQEEFVSYIVQSVLQHCRADLEAIGRDTAPLENVKTPFPRITYTECVKKLQEASFKIEWGEDFGAPEEVFIANQYDRPVFVEKFPKKIKAFYMQPDEENPEVALCADLLAPEGYGEIIGGSERIWQKDLLIERIKESGLNPEEYKWYLELREYGSVPHSGYGIGLERAVYWICGLQHIRESIPFARTLYRVYP